MDKYAAALAGDLEESKVKREMGSVAGFLLLDGKGRGALSLNVVSLFFNNVCMTQTRFLIDHPHVTAEMYDDPVVDMSMFRLLVSRLETRLLSTSMGPAEGEDDEDFRSMYGDSMSLAPRLRAMLCHPLYNLSLLFMLLLNMWACFQYGVLSTALLDSLGMTFMVLSVIDVLIRILAYSWVSFWSAHNDLYAQTGNRFDFWVAVMTVLGYLLSFTPWNKNAGLGFAAAEQDSFRIVLALPLLRLLTSISSLRTFVGFMYVLPLSAGGVILQLVCIFYVYGILGCILFARTFNLLANNEMPESVFDSFVQSQMTLYQLLLGAGWTTMLHTTLEAVGSVVFDIACINVNTLICVQSLSPLSTTDIVCTFWMYVPCVMLYLTGGRQRILCGVLPFFCVSVFNTVHQPHWWCGN